MRAKHSALEMYAMWLYGFIKAGGTITHYYPYPMPIDRWVVVDRPIATPEEYGANSLSYIFCRGVDYSGSIPHGHNDFYLMDGFECKDCFVPIYPDVMKRIDELCEDDYRHRTSSNDPPVDDPFGLYNLRNKLQSIDNRKKVEVQDE